jgi:hypothetical protein
MNPDPSRPVAIDAAAAEPRRRSSNLCQIFPQVVNALQSDGEAQEMSRVTLSCPESLISVL